MNRFRLWLLDKLGGEPKRALLPPEKIEVSHDMTTVGCTIKMHMSDYYDLKVDVGEEEALLQIKKEMMKQLSDGIAKYVEIYVNTDSYPDMVAVNGTLRVAKRRG